MSTQAIPAGEKQVLGPADQPFETDDGMLAFALYLAGAPFANDNLWCKNVYTVETLKKLGFSGQGLNPSQAALAAVKANKRGDVRFLFASLNDRLVKIFKDQEQLIEKEHRQGRELFRELIDRLSQGKMDREEFAVRLACVLLKTRSEFMNGWKQQDPRIRVMLPGKAQKQDLGARGIVVTRPGFVEVGASASEETKRRLGV